LISFGALAGGHFRSYRHWHDLIIAELIQQGQITEVQVAGKDLSMDLASYLELRSDIGFSISSHGTSNGLPLKGVFLYLIWAAEAAMVLGVALAMTLEAARAPYCETCDDWVRDERVARTVAKVGPEQLKRWKEASVVQTLVDPPMEELAPEGAPSVLYKIKRCLKCQQFAYLTIQTSETKIDGHGRAQTTSKNLWEFVKLNPHELERLESAARDATSSKSGEDERQNGSAARTTAPVTPS
jgi:hypothetical protein